MNHLPDLHSKYIHVMPIQASQDLIFINFHFMPTIFGKLFWSSSLSLLTNKSLYWNVLPTCVSERKNTLLPVLNLFATESLHVKVCLLKKLVDVSGTWKKYIFI